jgi:surfeit locus 1 family protein
MASNIKIANNFMAQLPDDDPRAEYARTVVASASRRRQLLWGGLLATLVATLFISLGLWQWRKFELKTRLQAELDERSRAALVVMPSTPGNAEDLRYRHVILRGEFDAERQIFIDNRVHREQAGYHVVTPLRLAGSDLRVLVNRGWLVAPADHRVQPVAPPPTGPVELTGIAIVPAKRFFTLAAPPAGHTTDWQPVWQNLDLASYASSVPWPIQPVVVQLDPEATHGYAREWPRPDERADMHRSYALQWFGFAASSLAIWLWFAVTIKRS